MTSAAQANVTIGPLTIARRTLLALTSASVCASAVLYICAPPIAPGVLIACLVPPLVWCVADGRDFTPWFADRTSPGAWLATAMLAFTAWMALSSLWSPNARLGFSAAVWCLVSLLVTAGVTTLGPRVQADARKSMAQALVAAFVFGTLLLLIEALSDMALRRMVMSLVPTLRSRTDGTVIENGWVMSLPFFLIKKNVAVTMIMFWPALLVAVQYARQTVHKRALSVVVALFFLTVFVAGHDSSRVALGVSGAFWALAVLDLKIAQRTALAMWLLAALAVVPITLALYKADLHKASFVQYSGRHRIAIWGQTSENVLKKPIFGVGIAATRYFDEQVGGAANFLPGSDIPAGTNVHSHNVFLQTWHELGAVGALLLALCGLPLLTWINQREPRDQPYLLAAFATVAVIASLSWSLIAAWFVATFGIAVIFAQLAADAVADARQPGPRPRGDRGGDN